MMKVKDGYKKLIGTSYSGSANNLLLSNGGDTPLTSLFTTLTNDNNQISITVGGTTKKLSVAYATKASLDANGNVINSTYATQSSLKDFVTLTTKQQITGIKTFTNYLHVSTIGAGGNNFTENYTKPYTNKALVIGPISDSTTALYINRGGILTWNTTSDTPKKDQNGTVDIPALYILGAGGETYFGGNVIPRNDQTASLGWSNRRWKYFNGKRIGQSNNSVFVTAMFPRYSDEAIREFYKDGYTYTNGTNPSAEQYFKALCRWAINTYADNTTYTDSVITLIGQAAPGYTGTLILSLYIKAGKDETGLPKYCSGEFLALDLYKMYFSCVGFISGTTKANWTWSSFLETNRGTSAHNVYNTGDKNCPILFSLDSSNKYAVSYFDSEVTINPYRNSVTATSFVGALHSPYSRYAYEAHSLVYLGGQFSKSSTTFPAILGSDATYQKASCPSHLYTSGDLVNIMSLRLVWSDKYWHEIYCDPNNETMWHRNIQSGSAKPWKAILDQTNYTNYFKGLVETYLTSDNTTNLPNSIPSTGFYSIHNYSATGLWKNLFPENNYGRVLQFGGNGFGTGLLAWTYNHQNGYSTTGNLYWRSGDPGRNTESVNYWEKTTWKLIAFLENCVKSNVDLLFKDSSNGVGLLDNARVLALTGGQSLTKSSWSYNGNGYITATKPNGNTLANLDLAGASVLTFGNTDAYTQLFITAPTQSGHNGITNEMLFYLNHGSSYSPGWTRVLTNRNYESIIAGEAGNGSSDFTDGTELLTSYASNSGFSDASAVNRLYKRKASSMYNYIKSKLDSVYLSINGTATASKWLNDNNKLEYGAHGLQYFQKYSESAGTAPNENVTPGSGWWHIIRMNHGNTAGYFTDLASSFNGSLYYRNVYNGSNYGWYRIIDSNNYSSALYKRQLGSIGPLTSGAWYRCATLATRNDSHLLNAIISLQRSFNSPANEHYIFSISVGYDGQVNISQLSGCIGGHLITKVRVIYTNSSTCYFDFYVTTCTYSNNYRVEILAGDCVSTQVPTVTTATGGVEVATVNGMSSNYSFTGLTQRQFSSTLAIANSLAAYYGSTSTTTGIIKITLPYAWNQTMAMYEVKIYEYNSKVGSTLTISGYNYDGTDGWFNYGYTVDGDYDKLVRLAYDGSKCCILLGTTTTTWSYPLVFLNNICGGYTGAPSLLSNNYSISVITSESGLSKICTCSAKSSVYKLKANTDFNHTHSLYYYSGLPTKGESSGQAKSGSNTYQYISYPEGYAYDNGTTINALFFRMLFSVNYLHEIFTTTSKRLLWHRYINNKNPQPWSRIVMEDNGKEDTIYKVSISGNADSATLLQSSGRMSTMLTGTNRPSKSGLTLNECYNLTGAPVSYGNILLIKGKDVPGCGELLCEWTSSDTTGHLYYRSLRDTTNSWSAWKQLAFSNDVLKYQEFTTSPNANTLTQNGIYNSKAPITNAPVTNWGALLTIAHPYYAILTYWSDSGYDMYIRRVGVLDSTTTTGWKRLLHSGDLTTNLVYGSMNQFCGNTTAENTGTRYYCICETTLPVSDNLTLSFYVSRSHDLSKQKGILQFHVRNDDGQFGLHDWSMPLNIGLDKNDFILTYKAGTNNALIVKLYVTITGSWKSYECSVLTNSSWGAAKNFTKFYSRSSNSLASLPSDETKVTTAISDCSTSAYILTLYKDNTTFYNGYQAWFKWIDATTLGLKIGDVNNNAASIYKFKADLAGAIYLSNSNGGGNFPLIFTNTAVAGTPQYNNLYTASTNTLYYNPLNTLLTVPKISLAATSGLWKTGKNHTSPAINISTKLTLSYNPILNVETLNSHYISLGGISDLFGFLGYHSSLTGNGTTWRTYWNVSNGTLIHEKSIQAAGGFFQTSDATLKIFKDDIKVDFDKLKSIPKKYFYWKSDDMCTLLIGTSAQEVLKLYPELVSSNDGILSVAYDKLSILALKSIDELYEMIINLKSENEELRNKINALNNL